MKQRRIYLFRRSLWSQWCIKHTPSWTCWHILLVGSSSCAAVPPTSTQDSIPRWQGMPSSSFSISWVSCLHPPMASVTPLMATMTFTTPSGIVPIVSDCVTYPTLTFSLHPSHMDFSFPELRKFPPAIPSAQIDVSDLYMAPLFHSLRSRFCSK